MYAAKPLSPSFPRQQSQPQHAHGGRAVWAIHGACPLLLSPLPLALLCVRTHTYMYIPHCSYQVKSTLYSTPFWCIVRMCVRVLYRVYNYGTSSRPRGPYNHAVFHLLLATQQSRTRLDRVSQSTPFYDINHIPWGPTTKRILTAKRWRSRKGRHRKLRPGGRAPLPLLVSASPSDQITCRNQPIEVAKRASDQTTCRNQPIEGAKRAGSW